MRQRTFATTALLVILFLIVGAGYFVHSVWTETATTDATQQVQAEPTVRIPGPFPVYPASTAVEPQPAPTSIREVTASTQEIKAKVEQWLKDHADRQSQSKLNDIMPGESFRATAIRFNDADAAKFSNDPRQWSQIKLDLDRNGKDDEKWLLKNGSTYKRETLDSGGKVTGTYYF